MKRTRTRTGFVLALISGALMLGLTDAALAAKTPTTFADNSLRATRGPINTEYSGKIVADGKTKKAELRCRSNRQIQIIHNGVVIAETRTNKKGTFLVTGPSPPPGDKVVFKILPKPRCGTDTVEVPVP